MNLFGKDICVSLVDDAFIFCTQNSQEPLVLSAYIATRKDGKGLLACGEEARDMLDREPDGISVCRVMAEGVISDQQAAQALFRYGVKNIEKQKFLVRPRMLVACRSDEPGKLFVKDMAEAGGAREVFLLDMAMATAIGMQLEVTEPEINAVLSVSDDWFAFAVISLAGVLSGENGAIGIRSFVEDIRNHLLLVRHFSPDIATLTKQLLSHGVDPTSVVKIPGWETWAGRVEQGRMVEQDVSTEDITVGLMPSFVRLTERIKTVIRKLSKEQQYRLNRTTIHTTGAAMTIPGFDQLLADHLGLSVTVHPAEIHPSIKGCMSVQNQLTSLKRVVV